MLWGSPRGRNRRGAHRERNGRVGGAFRPGMGKMESPPTSHEREVKLSLGKEEEAWEHNVTQAVLDEAHRVDEDGEGETTTVNGRWERMVRSRCSCSGKKKWR